MSKFERDDITHIIRKAAKELGIPIVSIFRAASVNHTNMNKWEKQGKNKAIPNGRTERKILAAIERLSKKRIPASKTFTPIIESIGH